MKWQAISIALAVAILGLQGAGGSAEAQEAGVATSIEPIQNSQHTLALAEGVKSPPATIKDMAWLTGYWQGEGFGGQCEEAWGEPHGDRMLGWFSLRKEGKLVLSEATALVEHEGSLVMRVKHFDAEFVGWEEKDSYMSFPLVKLGEQEAYFSGLTFRRSQDRLNIYLVVQGQDGKKNEFEFKMSRSQW